MTTGTVFEVGDAHPDAPEVGWWFGFVLHGPEGKSITISPGQITRPSLMTARPQPIIYICKDKRVVAVAETKTLSFSEKLFGLSEGLEALNKSLQII